MENTSEKSALRRLLLAKRQAITPEVRRQWDSAIIAHVFRFFSRHPAQTLGVFWPIRGEPDIRPAYAELSARGVRLSLPLTAERNAPLRFAEWTPGDLLEKDAMGVAAPAKVVETRPETLLVPCVGFNREKLRLGYGGGFYDRTLAGQSPPRAIGIAYACLMTEFAGDAHDIALDAIITESGTTSIGIGD